MSQKIVGNIVDLHQKSIFWGELEYDTRIERITQKGPERPGGPYLLPGFVDAHVHIESSMLVPAQFARLAVVHGTVATVSDPHEIANVCGMEGVRYMMDNGKTVPFKFYFGAPSCVPATAFETAGATVDAGQVEELLQMPEIHYLSEMMNFPGVLNGDEEVMKKISAARKMHKPIDGHAPGLRGKDALQYIAAGISTDHECVTRAEAEEKLAGGMKILIREGSAAKNFDALIDVLPQHENAVMFCSDDKHPDSLVEGHINDLCARAIARGIPLFAVLRAACVNPVEHYGLHVGLLRAGDPADFIEVEDLQSFRVKRTWIDGQLVATNGQTQIEAPVAKTMNRFHALAKKPHDFAIKASNEHFPIIGAVDGELVTHRLNEKISEREGYLVSDITRDILKIAVVNRYQDAPPSVGFIRHFGLQQGAIASSVAHDSHNIIAVGTDDESLCAAVNAIIEKKGGICVAHAGNTREIQVLPLPVAGLMSAGDGYQVALEYASLDRAAREAGSRLASPFMTLSFMALLVIPSLKISDLGLFDVDSFALIRS